MKIVNLILSKNSNLLYLKYLLVTLKFLFTKKKLYPNIYPSSLLNLFLKKEKKGDLNKKFGFKTFESLLVYTFFFLKDS